jgi:hypothetical protein
MTWLAALAASAVAKAAAQDKTLRVMLLVLNVNSIFGAKLVKKERKSKVFHIFSCNFVANSFYINVFIPTINEDYLSG